MRVSKFELRSFESWESVNAPDNRYRPPQDFSAPDEDVPVGQIDPEDPGLDSVVDDMVRMARAEAYEEGKEAGFKEGKEAGLKEGAETMRAEMEIKAKQQVEDAVNAAVNEHHKRLEQLAAAITPALNQAARDAEARREDHQAQTAKLAYAIAQKLAGAALTYAPQAAIMEHILNSLSGLPPQERVTITVPESQKTVIEEELANLAHSAGFRGEITLKSNPSLQEGDCQVAWEDGHSIREQARLLGEIEALLSRYVSVESSLSSPTNAGNAPHDAATPTDLDTTDTDTTGEHPSTPTDNHDEKQ